MRCRLAQECSRCWRHVHLIRRGGYFCNIGIIPGTYLSYSISRSADEGCAFEVAPIGFAPRVWEGGS